MKNFISPKGKKEKYPPNQYRGVIVLTIVDVFQITGLVYVDIYAPRINQNDKQGYVLKRKKEKNIQRDNQIKK